MGLDVYVGPLVRYYLGNWQNDVAQMIAEHGFPEDLRARFGEDLSVLETKIARRSLEVSTEDEAIETIQAWRAGLSQALGLETPLDWPESNTLPYYTRKPCWEGYEGLLLWAAYEDAGQSPPQALPENTDEDPALRRSRSELGESRYPHLLGETEIWLPGDCTMAFRYPDPAGKKMDFGFVETLCGELADLNQRTWRADLDTIMEWYDQGVEVNAPVEDAARFGFAVFYSLAFTAYEKGFPMMLDY